MKSRDLKKKNHTKNTKNKQQQNNQQNFFKR